MDVHMQRQAIAMPTQLQSRFCPQIRVGGDENKEANTIFDTRTRIYAKKYINRNNLKFWI